MPHGVEALGFDLGEGIAWPGTLTVTLVVTLAANPPSETVGVMV